MTRHAEVVMDANRYLSDEARVICYSCGSEAFESSGCCGYCHVPLEVSRSAQARGTKPSFVPVLGASNAGKTVFIGLLLDILSKGSDGLIGLPANAFSVAVQQQTLSALERRVFPQKTVCESEEWQWVHCEVAVDKKAKNFVDIVTPDLAGESIGMELDHPGSFPAVKTCVSQAQAVILLVDAVRARDGGSEEDLFATKLATYIHQYRGKTRLARKKVTIPIAITFTKSDLCPEVVCDPTTFAHQHLPSLVRYCDRYFAKIKYFATSAVGSVATIDGVKGPQQIPLHVQPQGITSPLAWIVRA